MKDQSRQFAKLFSQYLPSAMVFKCGLALLVICTVAAFVMAYYHDAYSSILELKELATTDVWFKLFVILMVLGAALLVGSPLLAMALAGITMLFPTKGPDAVEGQPTEVAAVVKEEAPSVEEKAPAIKQPERVIINEARLRTIFNSDYMTGWSDEPGKMYVDKVVEDLQFVRDNYRQGAKDKVHFADKHIIEIADILHKNRYFKRVTNSFTEWCCTLFDCLSIDLPERGNIKKPQEYSDLVKKRFFYLL
ncbi:MAG: hypothetical protein IJ653_06165 [Bacteroidales bacterium]|nr:hypothetical protein [Bacteroidales bacterium]